jgi:hypothetical protein
VDPTWVKGASGGGGRDFGFIELALESLLTSNDYQLKDQRPFDGVTTMKRAIGVLAGAFFVAAPAIASELTVTNNCATPLSVAVLTYKELDESGTAPMIDEPHLLTVGRRSVAVGESRTFEVGTYTYLFAERIGSLTVALGHISNETRQFCRGNFADPSNGQFFAYESKRPLIPDSNGNYMHAYTKYMMFGTEVREVPTNTYATSVVDCPLSQAPWTRGKFTRVPAAVQEGSISTRLCQ